MKDLFSIDRNKYFDKYCDHLLRDYIQEVQSYLGLLPLEVTHLELKKLKDNISEQVSRLKSEASEFPTQSVRNLLLARGEPRQVAMQILSKHRVSSSKSSSMLTTGFKILVGFGSLCFFFILVALLAAYFKFSPFFKQNFSQLANSKNQNFSFFFDFNDDSLNKLSLSSKGPNNVKDITKAQGVFSSSFELDGQDRLLVNIERGKYRVLTHDFPNQFSYSCEALEDKKEGHQASPNKPVVTLESSKVNFMVENYQAGELSCDLFVPSTFSLTVQTSDGTKYFDSVTEPIVLDYTNK